MLKSFFFTVAKKFPGFSSIPLNHYICGPQWWIWIITTTYKL